LTSDYTPPSGALGVVRSMAGLDQASRPFRALIGAPEQIYGGILERATAWVVTRREHQAARSDPV